jgi:hypothetical protein
MRGLQDIRYSAGTPATTTSTALVWPVRVVVCRPTAEQALSQARQVVEQFREVCAQAGPAGSRLSLGDFAASFDKLSGRLVLEQRSAKEAQVQLEFLAVCRLAGPADFWDRAAVVAWSVDAVQGFCQRSWPKGVEVIALEGRVVNEPAV